MLNKSKFIEAFNEKTKRKHIFIFALTFVVIYLCICFCIPGMRIKLEAEPLELFVKSIEHTALFKGFISLVVGFAIVILVNTIKKRKAN